MIRYYSKHGYTLAPAMPGDAGCDLPVAEFTKVGRLPIKIPTGIHLEMPPGFYAAIVPRSSAASKLHLAVCTGTIDSGYRGDISVVAYVIGWRNENDNVTLEAGDSIAQLVFGYSTMPEMTRVLTKSELSETARGTDGFGSTHSEFFFDGDVWTANPGGAIARIKRRGSAYNWFCAGSSGVTSSMSEAVTACMRSLGISERYI